MKMTVNTGIRLDADTTLTLRQLAGPRGGSKLIRSLIRAEAARRAIMDGNKRAA